jgi:hypothetical protein
VDVFTTDKGPAIITPAGGVTVTGPLVLYGAGTTARLLKTGTDTWFVMNVCYSPGPVLHRKVTATIANQFTISSFVKMRLDGSNNSATYTNNFDSLGTNQQYDSTVNATRAICQRSGWYDTIIQVGMAQNGAGRAYIRVSVNGTPQKFGGGGPSQTSGIHQSTAATGSLPLNVGDYVEFEVYIEGGSSGQFPADENHAPSFFHWNWRRPLVG